MAAYFALLQPGDTMLGMDLSHGGHLTHGSHVNFSGRLYRVLPYGVRESDQRVDFDALADLARREKPAMIIAGASAYPRTLLIAAGVHPSPVPHSDVVTSTTHKTLRGPRGGLILCREEHAKAIDKTVFPGMQGGPLMHSIAAKAVAFTEVMRPEFRAYSQKVIDNARALGRGLEKRGYDLVAGGTDTHLLLVDLRSTDLTGKDGEEILGRADIHVNKNTVPFETRSPFVASGIRIGTPALTTRGMGPEDMLRVADLIDRALRSAGEKSVLSGIRAEVRELCEAHPLYPELVTGRSAAGWSELEMGSEPSREEIRGAPAG
jgi:glycine hydroxymethyltransferase